MASSPGACRELVCVYYLQMWPFYNHKRQGGKVIKWGERISCISSPKDHMEMKPPGKHDWTTLFVWSINQVLWHLASYFCNCGQTTVSSASSEWRQTIFPHYKPIRKSGWSLRGTAFLSQSRPPPVQQRSLLLIYWFHTTPPRSTITFSIKLLILSDGV